MQIPKSTHCSIYHIDHLFSLKIKYHKQATRIIMSLHIPTVNTESIPETSDILSRYLPSVLESACFNDQHLPFSQEVYSTEIGHLFEHILLEYLCHYKLSKGHHDAEYSGVTQWDWKREPWGVFNITINTGFDDQDIIAESVDQSIKLLQIILCTQKMYSSYYPGIQNQLPLSPRFETRRLNLE